MHAAGVWSTVLGLASLLALAVLMVPVARRLAFPFTVLLALVGIGLGLGAHGMEALQLPVLTDMLGALHRMEITADAVLFVFLPVLVFEAALAMNVRRLVEDLGPILFLAVVGLLLSTAIIGLSLAAVSGMALVACLMLGAICSATDPVAVVAIFKEVGAPKRLAILVEGESLFNDATAIVLFTLLATVLTSGVSPTLGQGLADFLRVFLGGVAVGLVLGRLFMALLPRLGGEALAERSLTVALAYFAFLLGEHYLHVSGVMAVVSAALVLSARGPSVLSPHHWHGLHETWEQLGFWANSLIFLLVGLAVPGLLADFTAQQGLWLAVLVVTAVLARAAIIFGLLPLLTRGRLAERVSPAFKAVMLWGGLRGAVSLALALIVLEDPRFPAAVQQFVGVLVAGFVLFTLFVQAPTVGLLLRFIRLDALGPEDRVLRDRALAGALEDISQSVSAIAERQKAPQDVVERVSGAYHRRSEDAGAKERAENELSDEAWVRLGLANLAVREQRAYAEQFEEGFLASPVFRTAAQKLEDLQDGLRMRGLAGWAAALDRNLAFDWRFRLALSLQRRFAWLGPLSGQVRDRFERLTATELALGDVRRESLPRFMALMPAAAARSLEDAFETREAAITQALESLRSQYPEYAAHLSQRILERGALRLEGQRYEAMLEEGVLTPDAYRDLRAALRAEEDALAQLPLDLGLEPARLLAKVGLFSHLEAAQLARLAERLRPRLVLPEETVVEAGTPGQSMFFISSGALRVETPTGPVLLGSGDFFGELALLDGQPRNATVVAAGFADLLELGAEAFQAALAEDAALREAVEAAAATRRGA